METSYDLDTSIGLNKAIAEATRFGDDYIELEEWAEDMGISIDSWKKPDSVPQVAFDDWYMQKVMAKKTVSLALIRACKEVRGRAWFSDLLRLGNDLLSMRRQKAGGGLVDKDGNYTARTNYSGGIADLSPEQLRILLQAVAETEQRFAPATKLQEGK